MLCKEALWFCRASGIGTNLRLPVDVMALIKRERVVKVRVMVYILISVMVWILLYIPGWKCKRNYAKSTRNFAKNVRGGFSRGDSRTVQSLR